MKGIPLFYFPLSICWVDDDPLFLDAAKQLFQTEYHCLSFVDSRQALTYLNSYQTPSSKINFTRELIESDISDNNNHLPVDLNISEITNLSNMSNLKNEEIGLLIIDNNMPYVKGIDICQHLINKPYKKILLTGQTGLNEVVDAFNRGIIDKFITKDRNVSNNLKMTIAELSRRYFYEQTKNLIKNIEASRLSPLSDPVFINFFYNWLESNAYKEFYLIDKSGSFLVRKNDRSIAYFIVFTEHAKNEFLKLNDDAITTVGDLLNKLSQGQSIPFFGIGKESWHIKHTDWYKYFYPSNTLVGREKYYWTIINEEDIK